MDTALAIDAGCQGLKLDEEKIFLSKRFEHHLLYAFKVIQILLYPVIK